MPKKKRSQAEAVDAMLRHLDDLIVMDDYHTGETVITMSNELYEAIKDVSRYEYGRANVRKYVNESIVISFQRALSQLTADEVAELHDYCVEAGISWEEEWNKLLEGAEDD